MDDIAIEYELMKMHKSNLNGLMNKLPAALLSNSFGDGQVLYYVFIYNISKHAVCAVLSLWILMFLMHCRLIIVFILDRGIS